MLNSKIYKTKYVEKLKENHNNWIEVFSLISCNALLNSIVHKAEK